jgi:predicted nucleotidyltransferase component of viral defense system
MKIHENKELFKEILDLLSIQTNIRADILEKDYYVCLILYELSQKQSEIKSYFKGGTALYKILNDPKRFSEDIDLTVKINGLSNSQAKKALENSSNKFHSLERLKGDEMEENKKQSITSVYKYNSLYSIQKDILQRYGKVKVEATSFTISEPVNDINIEPLIFKLSKDFIDIQKYLTEYDCIPFKIKAISLERIFVDKLLAIEFYFERKEYFDIAKHIYDIYQMYNLPKIQKMLKDDDFFIMMLSYKRLEETIRIGSDLYYKPLQDFQIFNNLDETLLKETYNKMLDIYVFNEKDKIDFKDVKQILNIIYKKLLSINDKEQEFLKSDLFKQKCQEYQIDYNEKYFELNNYSKQL